MEIDDPTEPELDKTIHVDMDATLSLPTEGERGSSSASPTPGRQFGQYQLHEELGRGGQGVVIRATDTRFDRTVAVKILSGIGPGSEGVLERFRREAAVVDGTLVGIRNQLATPTKRFELKPFWVSYLWQLENKDRPESEKRTKDEIRSAILKSLTIVKSAWKEGRHEDAHRELRSWLDRYLKQSATVARMVPIGVDRAAEEARKHGEGNLAAALSMEALSIARELYGSRHSTTLYHENRHSIILGDFGHRDEAIAGLEESLRVARDALSPGHDIILTALDHLAELRSTGGDPEAARGHMTERMKMTLAHVSVADANFLYTFARRARFECDQNGGEPGGAPAAIPWIEQLVTHLRDADPRPIKRLAEAYLLLGEWQLAAGQPDAAREQIALLRRTLGDKKRLPRKSLRTRLAALEKSVGPGREERRE